MQKPKVKTRHYVDWVEYKKYLETKHKAEFTKHRDDLWEWFCGTSDFGNGAYVYIERDMGYEPDHVATWFGNRLLDDYEGTDADDRGTIYLWVWW